MTNVLLSHPTLPIIPNNTGQFFISYILNSLNPLRTALAALLMQGLFLGSGFGCGLDWSLPDNHFENVNAQGKFSYWQKLGEIKVGDDFAFPIHLNFRGDRYVESAGLGVPNFMLGLTDASVVALDERRFLMQGPSGRHRTFRRDRKNPHILESGPKWAGEIQGDVITVSLECGARLVFQQGRLARMQVKDRTFEFIRNGNRVTEVREGGRPLATLRENRLTGAVELVKRGGEVITFELGKRPLVQALAGSPTPVIGGLIPTVSKIILPDGKETRFDFGTDEKLLPTVGISGGEPDQTTRAIAWNPGTGEMIQDGEWRYEIKPDENPRYNAAIARVNGSGVKEFWHKNQRVGEKIEQLADGSIISTTWFTSGPLANRIRRRTITVDGKTRIAYQPFYDEKAKIVRMVVQGKMFVPHTDAQGQFRLIPWTESNIKNVEEKILDKTTL